jgi:hypothetical protein
MIMLLKVRCSQKAADSPGTGPPTSSLSRRLLEDREACVAEGGSSPRGVLQGVLVLQLITAGSRGAKSVTALTRFPDEPFWLGYTLRGPTNKDFRTSHSGSATCFAVPQIKISGRAILARLHASRSHK